MISERQLKLAARGDREGVGAMLTEDPGLINARSGGHGRTLLFEAANKGRAELVEALLGMGADPDISGRYRHETLVMVKPLVVARTKKHARTDALLTPVTHPDVFTAAYLGTNDFLEAMLQDDSSLADARQTDDEVWHVTPLHHAVAGGNLQTVSLLLAHGARADSHGRLLFDIACRKVQADIIPVLVEAGADPAVVDAFSVLHSNSPELIEYFFERGCEVQGTITYVARGDKGEHPEWLEALLRYGAGVDERDDKGRTPLHNSARAGFCRNIRTLTSAGADLNARTLAGETPLGLAVRAKRAEAAALLRELGGEL